MNDLFDAMQDAFVAETKETAEELEVDDAFASAIVYLRSRSRWTQELEDKLLKDMGIKTFEEIRGRYAYCDTDSSGEVVRIGFVPDPPLPFPPRPSLRDPLYPGTAMEFTPGID
jgi:CRISPR/Cas system CSM-associated protein Csm5 (group 7 of RAMP superfamily)